MQDASLFCRIESTAQSRGAAPFLIAPDGSILSYADMLLQTAQIANALVAKGVIPGDRVAVQVEKSEQALFLYLATIRAGAVFLPLNTAYTVSEVDYFLGDAAPTIVVCDPSRAPNIASLDSIGDATVLTLDASGQGSLADASNTASREFQTVPRGADDLASLCYTSGTTGRSKGTMLTHRALLSNAETLAELWGITEADTLLHMLPIYHVHGLFVATNTLMLAGGAMLFHPRFDTVEAINSLPDATMMMGVPTFYTRLLSEAALSANLCANMRLFISGSAPLLEETHRDFKARTGHQILERYGMTETGMNTSNPLDGARKPGSVGPSLPGVEVRVCDDDGAVLPGGKTGSVEVRGPNVFKGYWRMPEKTAAEFRSDGFFITGDMGKFDEEGYLHIVGRSKDLIISGGLNVYPKEVEAVIDDAPGVNEAAVIGVPHKDLGEAVVAIVAINAGATAESAAIEERCREMLAGFKRPKAIRFVEQLPRNAMGKVQKAALRDEYRDIFLS